MEGDEVEEANQEEPGNADEPDEEELAGAKLGVAEREDRGEREREREGEADGGENGSRTRCETLGLDGAGRREKTTSVIQITSPMQLIV